MLMTLRKSKIHLTLNTSSKIVGIRRNLALMLSSKSYDITLVLLIVLYTALVLVQFGTDGQDFYDKMQNSLFIAELIILGVFVFDILLHILAYGFLYLRDIWNIVDIVIIIVCLIFVFLDLFIDSNNSFRSLLKIRGIFRLLRIFILIRKLNAVRIRHELSMKKISSS